MDFWPRVNNFAKETTDIVGKQLLMDFGHVQGLEKADGSLVTKSDQWADDTIRTRITECFPDHAILSEEGEHCFTDAQWTWIIDPLDGTTNFTRGIPLWGVSLGLLYHGVPVYGCVYFPPVNQRFHGYYGGDTGLDMPCGSYLNDRPIASSTDAPSKNHFFSLCARSTQIITPDFPCKIRMLGVATYNFLAVSSGATLGGVEATPKIWDLAGIYPIIKASGAVWISLRDRPTFPAIINQDYGSYALPTLILSREDLTTEFTKLTASLRI